MRRLFALAGIAFLLLPAGARASSLNKCIDAQGKVTYSNLPCRNAQEVRTLELDPVPPPPPRPAKTAAPAPAPTRQPATPASLHLDTQRTSGKPAAAQASQRRCDAIADKLGSVLDKMDQARRKGYTQKQVDAWNAEIREIERKKQQAGCF